MNLYNFILDRDKLASDKSPKFHLVPQNIVFLSCCGPDKVLCKDSVLTSCLPFLKTYKICPYLSPSSIETTMGDCSWMGVVGKSGQRSFWLRPPALQVEI